VISVLAVVLPAQSYCQEAESSNHKTDSGGTPGYEHSGDRREARFLNLDKKGSDKRTFPAIDIPNSETAS